MNRSWSKEQQSLPARECMDYFREHSVFDRMFRGFREKYVSYGSFSGTVVIKNLSEEDLEVLEGFFQKNFHGKKSVSVSAARFEKALKESRFGDLLPKEVLELYFGEEMAGKKEQQREEEALWSQVFEEAGRQCVGTAAEQWLHEIMLEKGESYFYLRKRYRETGKSMEELKKLLELGIRVINGFPYRENSLEYLAVFGARMTGNPHAFDDGERDGQFLRFLIQWDNANRGIRIKDTDIFPALQKQKSYLAAGILRDDISNYVLISGIRAWKRQGRIHEGMEGFYLEKEPVQVPLSVIAGWERVECPNKEIYIVENPSVFAMLCGKWAGEKACMCMNGQPRLSAVLLLDLLAKAGIKVYYAGDFDPEGLLIAQKVRYYYQGEAVYWKMSVQEYEKSKSAEIISAKRMKMLERIEDEELLDTVAAMRASTLAGYQENIWKEYQGE